MANPLEAAHIPSEVLAVLSRLQGAGFRAFVVGGGVRDLLLEKAPKDYDIASSATPDEVLRLFRKVIPTGIEHGTVTVLQGEQHVEVTTFRAEADYVDGRHPSRIEFKQDIEADLGRRDFTINAIAWDPVARVIVDPFDGQGDLGRRVIRCVGLALERFSEDGLRPLRAVRFATVLGFTIADDTFAAIDQTLHVFRKVAAERVHQEFEKILLADAVAKGLALLERTKLLEVFFSEAVGADFTAVSRTPPEVTTRLATLLAQRPDAGAIAFRLRFPRRVADDVAHLVQHQTLPSMPAPDVEVRRWLSRVRPEYATRLLDVARARGIDTAGLREAAQRALASGAPLSTKALALDGKGIMNALGMGPCRAVGDAGRFLLERVLEEPADNTPERLRQHLAAWKPPAA